MSLSQDQSQPVHFPADPSKFAFDAEVSAVFENMAVRSIPNFLQAHQCHAEMCAPWIRPGARVMDIGASRGAFFHALGTLYPEQIAAGEIDFNAIDNSADMCTYLKEDYPHANVQQIDISSDAFLRDTQGYDIVCVNYVLQFIKPELQRDVLFKLFRMVREGGVLIFGHKAAHAGESGELAHEQYIRWRMKNGYTRAEIEAKTRALRGSMFPRYHEALLQDFRQHFHEVTETFRFMMFSTIFAVK